MNKKVTLSLLSATVFASMAASAFAAPTQGVYMGGSVDKFYKLDDLFNLSAAAKKQFVVDMNAANPDLDFKNLVFVDFDGKGAKFSEILAAGTLPKAKRDLTKADFEGSYVTVNLDGSNGASYDPRNDAVDVPTGDLKVESVSAINATTLTINFGAAVDTTTATNPANYKIDGTALDTAWSITSSALKLSDDKKSVTITVPFANALTNNQTYRIQVTDSITDKAGNKLTPYDQLFKFTDTTAPTVTSTVYNDATKKFTINFSEPLASDAASKVTVFDDQNQDVTAGTGRVTLSTDRKSIVVDASVTTAYAANKTYKVVILGATDTVGNYFANNRVEASFKVAKADEVVPTVATLEAKDQKTVRVTFSEPLFVDASASNKIAELKVDGGTTINVTKQSALGTTAGNAVDVNGDGKTWDVLVSSTNLSGAKKISFVNFKDLQGNAQTTAYEKFVTFSADQTPPALISNTTAGTKLYLTLNEDTVLTGGGTVTVLTPDNIEKTLTLSTSGAVNLSNDGSDLKTVIIDLGSTIVSKAGTYKVTIPSGAIADAATNSQGYTVTATFNTAADTTKPTLLMNGTSVHNNAVIQTSGSPSEFTIEFSEKVDSSALNVNNYKLNGANVFESAVFVGDTNKVKLTVRSGAIDVSGKYLLTVSGIKDLAGNTMDAVTYEENATINENVAPTVTAKLTTAKTITLTFSETVSGDAAADFEVYVGGTKVALDGTTPYASGVITLASDADVTKDIVVKVVGDIADTPGNKVAKGDVVVSK